MIYEDAEPADFFHREKRKARVNSHVCCECLRDIRAGEIYHVAKGKWGGGFRVFKTCAHCEDLASLAGGSLAFGDLIGFVLNTTDDPAIAGYLASMKRKWRDGDGRLEPLPVSKVEQNEPV